MDLDSYTLTTFSDKSLRYILESGAENLLSNLAVDEIMIDFKDAEYIYVQARIEFYHEENGVRLYTDGIVKSKYPLFLSDIFDTVAQSAHKH